MSRTWVLRSVRELELPQQGRLSYATDVAQPPRSGELDAYREEADRFIAALDEEYYLHFAGLKDDLELAPIYERYSDLVDARRLPRARRRDEPGDGARPSSGASPARDTSGT